MSLDTKAYNIREQSHMAELIDLLDDRAVGDPVPALFVADRTTGNPKFWVKTEPAVYLVGSTAIEWGDGSPGNEPDSRGSLPGLGDFFRDEGLNPFPNETMAEAGDMGSLCEVAGRLCYYSFNKPRPGGHEAYIRRIVEEGHGSVLEHAYFNFILTGVSRTFSHELVRHRLASYSQLSQRYFEEVACAFVCPPRTVRNEAYLDRWLNTMETAYDNYVAQVEEMKAGSAFLDVPKETDRRKAILGEARSQLPNATETKLMLSCNARCLRGILDQRGSEGADQEIRRVAVKLYDLVFSEAPSLFRDYMDESQEGYGRTVWTNYKKV